MFRISKTIQDILAALYSYEIFVKMTSETTRFDKPFRRYDSRENMTGVYHVYVSIGRNVDILQNVFYGWNYWSFAHQRNPKIAILI